MTRNAIRTGVLFAIIAAVAFGLTAPIIAWAGKGLGPLTTAALLYAGAALAAGAFQLGRRTGEHRLQRSDARRIIAIAVAGAAIGPTLLAWGLLALSGVPALRQFGLALLSGIAGAVLLTPLALRRP